jgi:hypothetical protein
MKVALTAIGLGAILACACNGALAQTVTTTQQGTANTSYTEQFSVEASRPTATTIQIGNNNRAGDPDTRTPGIIQRNTFSPASAVARIYQNGNANTASIVQDTADILVNADIEQVGNYNRAAIIQIDNVHVDAWLRQNGTSNVAVLNQTKVDGATRAVQNGSGNKLTFSQNGVLQNPALTQTGTQNEILFSQDEVTLGVLTITQTGDSTIVTGSQTSSDGTDSIVQVGTGNNAALVQSGAGDGLILQNGNYNFASLNQLGNSKALITQTGNHNRATVTQIGDAFVASITQTGAYNRAGVYQH